MSIILVKCKIAGSTGASETAPGVQELKCWLPHGSGAAQWKSNRIALGEEWVRKGTLWN